MSESVAAESPPPPIVERIAATDWSEFSLVREHLTSNEREQGKMDTTGIKGRPLIDFTGESFEVTWIPVQ